MDLKFTFGGASPDHGHAARDRGDAPSGVPLPFTTPQGSSSSLLELHAGRSGGRVSAQARSGDGVVYASGEAEATDDAPAAIARALRSALSRAVAGLEGPLSDSVSRVVVELGAAGAQVLGELGLDVDGSGSAAVDEALQRRIGVAAGTPISLAA